MSNPLCTDCKHYRHFDGMCRHESNNSPVDGKPLYSARAIRVILTGDLEKCGRTGRHFEKAEPKYLQKTDENWNPIGEPILYQPHAAIHF